MLVRHIIIETRKGISIDFLDAGIKGVSVLPE